MKAEIARPGVQHGGDAEQGSQALGVQTELEQCLRSSLEQQSKQVSSIPEDQRAQLRWQSEHHVEVMHRQDARLALFEPAVLRQCLALGAVPIPTRVVLGLPVSAPGALLDVPAERSGAASSKRCQHLPLLGRQ